VVEITGTKDTEVEVDRAAEAIGGKPVGDLVMLSFRGLQLCVHFCTKLFFLIFF